MGCLVRRLSHKHQGLNSDPQQPHKRLGGRVYVCPQYWDGREITGSLGLAGSPL